MGRTRDYYGMLIQHLAGGYVPREERKRSDILKLSSKLIDRPFPPCVQYMVRPDA